MDQVWTEVENTDPTQHQRWLDKHQLKPGPDGSFSVKEFEGALPVEQDKLYEYIRENVSTVDYIPLFTEPYDERTFVMVCGGPSLADHLDEIRAKSLDRERYAAVCSNMTGSYLLENGIIPYAHFILDPKESKALDVAPGKTSPDVRYWINAACHPKVFQTLAEQGIKPYMFLADFDKEGKAVKAVKESLKPGDQGMMVVQGGTMAGLRAMNIADALGFRKVEYYGFDATVRVGDGVARPYAYDKKRGEAIIEVKCDRCDEWFDTTLIFQRQVNEFIHWRHNLRWIDFKLIGGGLIAHYVSHIEAIEAKKHKAKYRYTEAYKKLQQELHTGVYGVSGEGFSVPIFHAISQLAKRLGGVSVLDYGSAGGNTMKFVRKQMWLPPVVEDRCYDPFVDEFSAEPEPADLVLCIDVLEHVEPECTDAVLDHLASLTKRLIFLSIAMTPANKNLSDGRNAHINLRDVEAWLSDIRKRFITSEVKLSKDGENLMVVAQAIEDVRQVIKGRK